MLRTNNLVTFKYPIEPFQSNECLDPRLWIVELSLSQGVHKKLARNVDGQSCKFVNEYVTAAITFSYCEQALQYKP